ncbi:MAG: nucleotidyltransferase domain-containing protein [Promethearchaeota archaeon]
MNTELHQKLKNFVAEVKREYHVYSVILYGSHARSEVKKDSDIDIVVVADFNEIFLDRIGSLIEIGHELPNLEPLGYTKEEFVTMFKKGHVTVLDCLEEGEILYDDGLIGQLKVEFNEAKQKGLRKTKVSWIIDALME